MPPRTPREARSLREALEALESLDIETPNFVREGGNSWSGTRRESIDSRQAREARLIAAFNNESARRAAWNEREFLREERWPRTHPVSIDSRRLRESLMATIDDEPAGRVAWNEPELVINRATTLLACICLIRIQNPQWTNQVIADLLQYSFPEFTIYAGDIRVLFHASCRNRPRWVDDMFHRDDFRQRTMGLDLLELLPTNALAHLPQLPQEHYRDRREGIRYLQELVGIEVEHRSY
ncbi:hypothetical protein MMC29_004723 [Sticta canariensis]|nr:hypothetical protein [Sticta canariensis]